MKKHSGMRPHDIVILLKIAAKGESAWYMKDLAYELKISASEISESLHRSSISGLLSPDKKDLMKLSVLDFLQYGLRFVYPSLPGPIVRGIPTAHAAAPLNKIIVSNEPYVWPHARGTIRGESIEPLHPNLPDACLSDPIFYEYVALMDSLRVGKSREKNLAIKELKQRILHGK